ncbi:hypothetical protein bthur0004_50650 [Bacillus thuringiensis serovar sotto str. T04001]|nr:hypothetical protein bthur0004_50650 [Bacillus thuringiensis serovar sotto str. T04001]
MAATVSPTAQFNTVYYEYPTLYFLMYVFLNGLYGAVFRVWLYQFHFL